MVSTSFRQHCGNAFRKTEGYCISNSGKNAQVQAFLPELLMLRPQPVFLHTLLSFYPSTVTIGQVKGAQKNDFNW